MDGTFRILPAIFSKQHGGSSASGSRDSPSELYQSASGNQRYCFNKNEQAGQIRPPHQAAVSACVRRRTAIPRRAVYCGRLGVHRREEQPDR